MLALTWFDHIKSTIHGGETISATGKLSPTPPISQKNNMRG